MRQWIEVSLARKMTLRLSIVLAVVSILFLLLVVLLYRDQLIRARAEVLSEVNGLLQVSLENAMLKRDLPGLRDIVRRFGERPDIVSVMIVNPQREVRFASREQQLGRVFRADATPGCEACLGEPNALTATSRFIEDGDGNGILRSIVPVRNRAPCAECHGKASDHPVNGVLVVDHRAASVRDQALISTALLGGAGLIVIALTGLAGLGIVRRDVIAPIGRLNRASHALSEGSLDSRVEVTGKDEISDLGRAFNQMAERLSNSLKSVRERERFLQEMIDAIPDAVRVIDENYGVVMANEAYGEQMDTDRDALIGVPCYAAHGRTEPCIASMVTCPIVALEDSDEPIKYMHRHVRADGEEVIVETTAARIERDDGSNAARLIVEAMRDVGRQVKYSQEQRLAELGQLATGIAHEIYNPLSSVRLGLQALMRKTDSGVSDPATIGRYLHMVDDEIDKCVEVTRRLLSLSVPPSKHLQLISLSQIIPDVASLLHFEAEKLDVRIDIDLGDDDLRVLATDSEMRMLFLNLMQNAFHAMPSGGDIIVEGHLDGDDVVVSIGDTGVGIRPENLAHIFDPFFSRRADDVEGTGLGLTICKATAARYDGTISVKSTVGEGSVFTVRLPRAERARRQND